MSSCCVEGCSDPAEHTVEYEEPIQDKEMCTRCAVFHYRRDATAKRATKIENTEGD